MTTGVVVAALLSVGSGSGVPALTEAVLVTAGAITAGSTVPVTAMVSGVPGVTAPTGQLTTVVPRLLPVPPAVVQAGPPLTEALTPVRALGTTSVTIAPRATDGPALVTRIVQDARRPAVNDAVSAVLATARFAEVVVSLVLVLVLLEMSGSGVLDPATAEFVTDGPGKSAASVPVTVAVRLWPLLTAPTAQCRFPPVIAHAGVGDAPVKLTPVGAVSSMTTSAASDGPELRTTICQVALPPATGLPDSRVLATEMSADAVTAAAAVALDASGVVFRLADATVPVLVTMVPTGAVAGTRIARVTDRVAPASTAAQVQVTGSANWQVPPFDALAVISVVPVGNGSVSTMLVVFDGPLLIASNRYATTEPATIGPLVMVFVRLRSERVATR